MSIQSQLDERGVSEVLISFSGVAPGSGVSLSGSPDRVTLLRQSSKLNAKSREKQIAASLEGPGHPTRPYRLYENLGLALATVDKSGLDRLQSAPEVDAVVEAPLVGLIAPRGIPVLAEHRAGATWGIERMKIDKLWQCKLTGKDVRVGHLDTGVDGGHPALRKAVAGFVEFDWLGNLLSGQRKPRDSGYHGTHTAGTIAGRPVKRNVIGVAPGAKLYCAMVLEGGVVFSRLLGGLDWALQQGVRIVNLSLGFPGYRTEFHLVIEALRVRGVLPVVAIGNEGPGTSRSPGNYTTVLSVGAMTEQGTVWANSSSRTFEASFTGASPRVPDVVAPGESVYSSFPVAAADYGFLDGTSMAAPHVSGLAALLLEAKPTAGVDDLERAIVGSCRMAPGLNPARGGAGLPDAEKAYEILMRRPLPLPKRRRPKAVSSKTKRKRALRSSAHSRPALRRLK